MKRKFGLMVIFVILLCGKIIYADDDDAVPYLSDDDIAAIEMVLPEDVPEIVQEEDAEIVPDEAPQIAVETDVEPVIETNGVPEKNEIARLNTSQRIYHLLILDRKACPVNSDISGIDNMEVIYKYRHGTNGYLIALYTSPQEGPVFPLLPDKSRILVNLVTVRIESISEYIDSAAFKRFVTNRTITSDLKGAVKPFL